MALNLVKKKKLPPLTHNQQETTFFTDDLTGCMRHIGQQTVNTGLKKIMVAYTHNITASLWREDMQILLIGEMNPKT